MGYPPQPQYAPQPQQGYAPPAPPGYAPPPPGYAPAPLGYYAPPPPAYAPPVPQYAPAAPAPVLARGTLEDFMGQPSASGGQSVTKYFQGRPQNSWLQMVVTRNLTHADVRQQTDLNGVPLTFKDGTPKLVLILPVQVVASGDGAHPAIFTDSAQGSLWLKGLTTESFKQAMGTAGVDPDETLKTGLLAGATIVMVSAGEKPSQRVGHNPAKLYNFTYTPGAPQGAVPPTAQPAAVPTATPPAAPMPLQSTPPAPAQYAAPMAAPAPVPAPPTAAGYAAPPGYADPSSQFQQAIQGPPQQYAQMVPPPPGYAPQGAPPPSQYAAQGPSAPVPPPQDAEKAALLRRLQGGQG